MRLLVRDYDALKAIRPMALHAYAYAAGWREVEDFGRHSVVYDADGKPEVILPRTERLGDYVRVVSQLIEIFAEDAGRDELSLYHTLAMWDRDIVRIRVGASDDGRLAVNHGVNLIAGTRDMLLWVACSLSRSEPVYRAGANKAANDLLDQVRLGPTEQGSFAITVSTPVVSPRLQEALVDLDDQHAPMHRRMTERLVEALSTARKATERAVTGDETAFDGVVNNGVSANLCEALVTLIEPFQTLDVGVSWALTRPATSGNPIEERVRFGRADAPILGEAARVMKARALEPDVELHGFVQRLHRPDADDDGTIGLKASIDGRQRSISAMLEWSDYERAIEAHGRKALVVLTGDLDRKGQRWRLLNPQLIDVLDPDDPEPE